ncbi:MAG: helix-turn-helix domain-containing protein [Bacteroidota bacterium]
MNEGEKYILNLIGEGEHQQLDFKFAINDSAKIARTLSAFSNTEGGRLLIGVKDNGKIKGVQSEEEYYMIESSALRYCLPVVSFEVKKWIVEGKTVLEVYIPPAATRPVLARDAEDRWRAYIRVGDQNILANHILLQVWKRKQRPGGTLVTYTEREDTLLSFLSTHPDSEMDTLQAALGVNRKILKNLLINLISIGVISMDIGEKKTSFRIR